MEQDTPEGTRWREVSPGVFYPESSPVLAAGADLRLLEAQALASPRGRARLCAHPAPEAELHEMLVCLARATYIRPHRHLKPESALILRGACDLVLLDALGNVADVLRLSDPAGRDAFFVRLAEPVYHTYLVRSDFLFFVESKSGPLDRRLTEFAPWAPAEDEPTGDYVKDLRRRAELRRPAGRGLGP